MFANLLQYLHFQGHFLLYQSDQDFKIKGIYRSMKKSDIIFFYMKNESELNVTSRQIDKQYLHKIINEILYYKSFKRLYRVI